SSTGSQSAGTAPSCGNTASSQTGQTAQSTPIIPIGTPNAVVGPTAPLGAISCMAVDTTSEQGSNTQTGQSAQGSTSSTSQTQAGQTAQSTPSSGGVTATIGQTLSNCGFTVDVPAGTYNLQVLPANSTSSTTNPLTSAANTTLNANTYYLVAVT